MFEKSCADQSFSWTGVSESRFDRAVRSEKMLAVESELSLSKLSSKFWSGLDIPFNIRGMRPFVMKVSGYKLVPCRFGLC